MRSSPGWLELQAGGLVIGTDAFFISRSEQLAALAVRHAVPAIFQFREFAAAGGLMSYGGSYCGPVPSGWRLHRPHSQGREAGRPAGPAGHEGRADHQPQDRQGARHHRPAIAARPRRRGDRMKRREFITLLGGAAAWPLAARAQQAERERRIGLLTGEDLVVFIGAFREELQRLGWSDGRNLRIDRRASAAELIAINPDVMVAENTPPFRTCRGTHARSRSCSLDWVILSSRGGREPRKSGRQRYRIYQSRALHQRKMVGIAQGDRACHHPHLGPTQREQRSKSHPVARDRGFCAIAQRARLVECRPRRRRDRDCDRCYGT